MSRYRIGGEQLLAAMIVLLSNGPAVAITDCLVPLYGDTLRISYDGYELVPDTVLPAAFNAVFNLYVDWDWGMEEWWPDEEVIAFANLVVPDTSGTVTPEDSYAERTAYMFGFDQDPSYPTVYFEYRAIGGIRDYAHFDILIHGGGGLRCWRQYHYARPPERISRRGRGGARPFRA